MVRRGAASRGARTVAARLASPAMLAALVAPAMLAALADLAAVAPAAPADLAALAAPDSAAAPTVTARSPLPVEVHVQFGWLGRGGGTEVRREKGAYLAVGDLLALWRADRTWTWGLGLRLAGDDDGVRYGLSGVLRGRFAARTGTGGWATGRFRTRGAGPWRRRSSTRPAPRSPGAWEARCSGGWASPCS